MSWYAYCLTEHRNQTNGTRTRRPFILEGIQGVNGATVLSYPSGEFSVIVSEFGADAEYGRHGEDDERWTEEYQTSLFRHQLAMVERIPNLAGLSPWVLMDFRSPRRTLPGIQDYYNRKGLVSSRGQRKQAFYVLQTFYKKLADEGR